MLMLIGVAWKMWKSTQKSRPALAKAIREKLPEVLKLVTGQFQILGAFTVVLYRVPWPAAFTLTTRFFGVLNLDFMAFPTLRCSTLGNTFFARFDLHVSTTLTFTGLFVSALVYVYSAHNSRREKRVSRSLVWNTFLPFLFLIYPSISRTVILVLRCRTVDGASYLLSDMAISCETREYRTRQTVAILCLLVFPFGIVAFFTALVWHHRTKLPPDWWPAQEQERVKSAYQQFLREHAEAQRLQGRNSTLLGAGAATAAADSFSTWKKAQWDPQMERYRKVFRRFGFLFGAYTNRFWWFESLITVYKLCMTVLILFVSDGDELKILVSARALRPAPCLFRLLTAPPRVVLPCLSLPSSACLAPW
jgi:hypothetical protein